jgi:maltose O-acetyltransferase
VPRNPLRPHTPAASSRAWSFYVNVVGASVLLTGETRRRLYRWAGIQAETAAIGPACYFHTHAIRIGPRTLINHGCHFENLAPVEIGADCALGMRVMAVTSTHQVGGADQRAGEWGVRPVRVEDGCWIGAGVILLPGSVVGAGCVVAAGAVVRGSCQPNGLYGGVPARRLEDLP